MQMELAFVTEIHFQSLVLTNDTQVAQMQVQVCFLFIFNPFYPDNVCSKFVLNAIKCEIKDDKVYRKIMFCESSANIGLHVKSHPPLEFLCKHQTFNSLQG